MESIGRLEHAVMERLLAGDHPTLVILRRQFESTRLTTRELTGVGFYCSFQVADDAPLLANHPNFEISDVNAEVTGLQYGAGFVLFIRDGLIDMLEGFAYDERWPEQVDSFTLRYQCEPRDLAFLPDAEPKDHGPGSTPTGATDP